MSDYSYLFSVALLLLTPGPTNTLLFVVGTEIPWYQGIRFIGVEVAGYLTALILWRYLVVFLNNTAPSILLVIKIVSALFIFYLATKVWRSAKKIKQNQPSIRLGAMYFATLLNPKALIFISAIFPFSHIVEPETFSIVLFQFVAVLIPIGALWMALGAKFAVLMETEARVVAYRVTSIVLGGFSLYAIKSVLIQ
ncbi:LysE family translocator [Lampropedia puyangensis]|uniref:LysE family translocator n=1 Tax=Lampropedia puyangensis TaxID=1330072 RepID=A0A4S8FHG2_9BURK|nr:LysE family transporter [Lampropedia puyangensis]THU05222.1 LysE family translocator [Lampropedia puyangensis]